MQVVLQLLNLCCVRCLWPRSYCRITSALRRIRNINISVRIITDVAADVKNARRQHQCKHRGKTHQQHRKFRECGKSPSLSVTALSHNPTSQKQLPDCFQNLLFRSCTRYASARVGFSLAATRLSAASAALRPPRRPFVVKGDGDASLGFSCPAGRSLLLARGAASAVLRPPRRPFVVKGDGGKALCGMFRGAPRFETFLPRPQ